VLYSALLFLHSLLRWLVLVAGIATVVGAVRKKASPAFVAFAGLLDMQLVVGLVMYFTVSPQTKIALGNFGAAMKDSELRFWAVEHPTMMILALVLVHVGRVMSKRAKDDAKRNRLTLVFSGIALAILLVAIPWPFSHHARPLLPSL
jgi:hypothetical protein